MQVVKEEIINIEYAIHWAKAHIVNSYILSNSEINVTEAILQNEDFPYINIDEALEFAEVRIATNGNNIVYIVNLPTTKKSNCRNLKSGKNKRKINKIPFESILKCNEN